MANDERPVLDTMTIILQHSLKNARILSFQNSKTAWEALLQEDPDLLITDDAMPGLRGKQICEQLLEQNTTYPIIVNSAWEPTKEWVEDCASRGLNVRFLECPFTVDQLLNVVEASLKISLDRNRK